MILWSPALLAQMSLQEIAPRFPRSRIKNHKAMKLFERQRWWLFFKVLKWWSVFIDWGKTQFKNKKQKPTKSLLPQPPQNPPFVKTLNIQLALNTGLRTRNWGCSFARSAAFVFQKTWKALMATKPKLHYPNGRGRMESVRWVLAAAGVEVP